MKDDRSELRKALECHDAATADHSERVALVAWAIAHRLGWSAPACRRVRQAALLHDIGKLTCSLDLLHKPGKLTAEEWAEIVRHPQRGVEIIAGTIDDAMVIEVVLFHHERWNGTGYPDRLVGEAIPLAARVVAVADVFESLRSDRPYKAGWSFSAAVASIRAASGTLFDPVVVAAFLAVAGSFASLHPERNPSHEHPTHPHRQLRRRTPRRPARPPR